MMADHQETHWSGSTPMHDLYSYISEEKVTQLHAQVKNARFDVSVALGVDLKIVSAKADLKEKPSQISRLKEVLDSLDKKSSIVPLGEISLGQPPPVFFEFSGTGSVCIDMCYWLAAKQGHTALLLAGSPSNAAGNQVAKSSHLSPSLDPVGSFLDAADKFNKGDSLDDAANSLSYAWATIFADRRRGLQGPRYRGVAVFSAMCTPRVWQLERAGITGVDLLVVGSPLFVSQV